MSWPAYYNLPAGSVDRGTIYVPRHRIPSIIEHHGYRGQAWTFHHRYTSYAPKPGLLYKSWHGLKRHLKHDEFETIMGDVQRARLDPPSSYSDLFSQVSPIRWPRPTVIAPFWSRRVPGGWEQCFRYGQIRQPTYYYDLNRAYQWASLAPFPDPRSAMRCVRWRDYPSPSFWLVKLPPGTLPYLPHGGWHFLTSEERDMFSIREPDEIAYGLVFRRTVSLADTWARIQRELPSCEKRMSQRYWGLWACRRGPVRQTWKSGILKEQNNHAYNPILAHWIISRVKLKLVETACLIGSRNVLMAYVDALLTTAPLPVGTAPGEFKLKYFLRSGSTVLRPGGWGLLDGRLLKHSGIACDRIEVLDNLSRCEVYCASPGEDTDGETVEVSAM